MTREREREIILRTEISCEGLKQSLEPTVLLIASFKLIISCECELKLCYVYCN